MTLGEYIRKNRSKKGLAQEKLARELDVATHTVWLWENNQMMPAWTKLPKLAELLDVDLEELKRLKLLAQMTQLIEKHDIRVRVKSGGK